MDKKENNAGDFTKTSLLKLTFRVEGADPGDFIKYDHMLQQDEGYDGFKEAFQRAVNSENPN